MVRVIMTHLLFDDIPANPHAITAAEARDWQLEGCRKWKEVSASELEYWLEIVSYMRVYSSPAVEDYWRHDGLNPAQPICEYMGQIQFQEIQRYFHVSFPDLQKIAPTRSRL